MELFTLTNNPTAGENLNITFYAEPNHKLNYVIQIQNVVLKRGDCVDPPCHEMLFISKELGHKILEINVTSTSGKTYNQTFFITPQNTIKF
jgi:hypothetical protein